MKELFFLLSFLFSFNFVSAQFQDNFDDESFPNDPDWFGNTDIYIVNDSNELQLMDIDAGQSFIYAPVATADSTTWEFYFRLEFNPSSSNRLQIFLSSDSPDFDGNLNGYFLQIGQSGNEDAIELWRKDGSNSTMILAGSADSVAIEPAVRVSVTRNADAEWQLFADYSGGFDFQFEGSAVDATYSMGSYFGFHCTYSATRKDKFYFDDVLIGPTVLDETPPSLFSVSAIDANNVLVVFDETLDQNAAENVDNYSINNGITINSASLDNDPSQVVLSVSMLQSGLNYQLSSSNIEDLNGNASVLETLNFIYYEIHDPEPFDILINEIFPHPDPNLSGLPDAEYFEIYNRSDKAFNLNSYKIADASGSKSLPDYIFPPNNYLIICDEDDTSLFSSFGSTLGIPGLFKLNDSGDDLTISDSSGNVIHTISYNLDWYQDDEKDDGGWSIELVNPNLFCQGENNWRASNNSIGGTPGQENSVFDDTPDTTPPSLVDAISINQNQLRLFFDEILDMSAENPSNYSISNAGNVVEAVLEFPALMTVLLTIESPFFEDQTNYIVSVDEMVTDCSGNAMGDSNSAQFVFYATQPASRYDILINEIYPDPTPSIGLPEKEFIELYNRSEKTINLEGFYISNGNNEVTLPFHLLLPDQFVIIYGDGGEGYSAYGDTIVLDADVGLSNQSGNLELINPEGKIIHAIAYTIDWYQDNSKNDGGWTLELINPDAPCSFSTNWRASVNASGGTPGRANSILEKSPDSEGPDLVKVYPLDVTHLGLSFNEALDETTASDPNNYEIEGYNIIDAFLLPPLFNQVILTLASEIEEDQIYSVFVKSSLTDCVGNSIVSNNNAPFALPQPIEPKDIVINEVLPNPETGGHRFIELYNRSDKTIDISELVIASRNLETDDIEKPEPIETTCLLFPKNYIVITSSPSDIKNRYFVEKPYALVPNALPTYDDKEGVVLIYVPELLGENIIDEFHYTQDFHNQLLSNRNGVSLERIDPNGETNTKNNWHSAATSVGFATPTYQNSQFTENNSSSDDVFSIPNNTLSPDGDGFEDFLLINYQTNQSGYLANIRIFDSNGRLIKDLVKNELLASKGNFKWDGGYG